MKFASKVTIVHRRDTLRASTEVIALKDSKSRPDLSNTQIFLDALQAAGVPKDDPAIQRRIEGNLRLEDARLLGAHVLLDAGAYVGEAGARLGQRIVKVCDLSLHLLGRDEPELHRRNLPHEHVGRADDEPETAALPPEPRESSFEQRATVNVVIDHAGAEGAPRSLARLPPAVAATLAATPWAA